MRVGSCGRRTWRSVCSTLLGAFCSAGRYGGFGATIDPVLGTIAGNGHLIDERARSLFRQDRT